MTMSLHACARIALMAIKEIESHPEWVAALPVSDAVKAEIPKVVAVLDTIVTALAAPAN